MFPNGPQGPLFEGQIAFDAPGILKRRVPSFSVLAESDGSWLSLIQTDLLRWAGWYFECLSIFASGQPLLLVVLYIPSLVAIN